jgi:hypothetical protein
MWTDNLADALGVDRLSEGDVNALLDTARDIAHRVERKYTPVSTYLIGVAVAGGMPLEDANAKVAALLPAETES